MKNVALSAELECPPVPLTNVDAQLLESLESRVSDPDFWSSKKRDRSDSAHCIFQYPAMMVPLVQRRLLQTVIDVQPNVQSLYDPFVGSGTSLVSAMHFGLAAYGNDINPLAVLISRVRTARTVEFTISAISKNVVTRARADGKTTIETSMVNRDKWFKPEVALELSRLRRAIRRCDDLWVRRFLWVTLAETVRLTSNDRTSTYKLHARTLADIERRTPSPIKVFEDLAIQNSDAFESFRRNLRTASTVKKQKYTADTQIILSDSKNQIANDWRAIAPFDIMMTSPPYGDNMTTVTYGQHSYLPLNWIDLADIDEAASDELLRTTQEIDRRSLGGKGVPGADVEACLFQASPVLRRTADNFGTTSGDARSRLVRFYADFQDSLNSMIGLMRQNSYLIWTVGNRSIASQQVQTDLILGELLSNLGCEIVTTLDRQIHHKRMPNRNASSDTMKEERILLLRKL